MIPKSGGSVTRFLWHSRHSEMRASIGGSMLNRIKDRINENKVNYLSAPGLLLVILVTQVPFVVTIGFAFVKWNVKRPDLPITFAGIDNFVYLFKDGDFYRVLINTFIITFVSLALALVLAFLFALLFNQKVPGIAIARSILIIPYFVMEPVIGIVWKTLILSPTFGLNKTISDFLGITPIQFFDSAHSLWTIVMLCVWQWTPFLFLILLSGLQSLPEEIMEAAEVDGAGTLQKILKFKIPLMKPYFKVAGMFGMINLLKVFGLVFVTTQGGPGISSANLPYYVYRTGFYDWQIGRAAAISVVMVIITLVVIGIFQKVQGNPIERR